MMFNDRVEAGRRLAAVLHRFRDRDTVVMALPRGGVVLGAQVAGTINAPLGVILVGKIGHPVYGEYAVGAITDDGTTAYNPAERFVLGNTWCRHTEKNVRELLTYRRGLYYGEDLAPPQLRGKTVLIIDDGMATGLTVQAAVKSVRRKHPRRIIVAVPVASAESIDGLEDIADEIIVLDDPEGFMGAVGTHYREFPPVEDSDVKAMLKEASHAA